MCYVSIIIRLKKKKKKKILQLRRTAGIELISKGKQRIMYVGTYIGLGPTNFQEIKMFACTVEYLFHCLAESA